MSNYYVLCGKEKNQNWEFLFGDYNKGVVNFEKRDQKDGCTNWEKLKVFTVSDKQEDINNLMKQLNGDIKVSPYSLIEKAVSGIKGVKWIYEDKINSQHEDIFNSCKSAIAALEENMNNQCNIDEALVVIENLLDEVAMNQTAYTKISDIYSTLGDSNS